MIASVKYESKLTELCKHCDIELNDNTHTILWWDDICDCCQYKMIEIEGDE